MLPPSDDDMQMVLAPRAAGPDARRQDLGRFLDELPVQVDGVGGRRGRRVVLAEYVGRGLRVVLPCLGLVRLAFGREAVC